MKKLFLSMGLACLFMFACNNAPQQQEATEEAIDTTAVVEEVVEEHVCPMEAMKADLANWETMAEEERAALIGKIKAFFDEKDAAMAEGESCCQHAEGEVCEMTEEMKAKCEAMKAQMEGIMGKWAEWANMTIDDQKALIEERMAAMSCCHHAEEEAPVEEAPVAE